MDDAFSDLFFPVTSRVEEARTASTYRPQPRRAPSRKKDEETFTAEELDGVTIPPPQTEIVEWKYIMLPEDQKKVEERIMEDAQERIGEPNYVCELCRMGDMAKESSGNVSNMLQRVYEVEDRSYRRVPDRTRYESVARKYNETIFEKNERLGKKKIALRRWTPAMVRHHLTVCEQSRPERQIENDVDILNTTISFLKYKGLYRQKTVNGEEKDIELDKANHERLLKSMLTKASLLKMVDTFSSSSNKKRKREDSSSSSSSSSSYAPSAANAKKDVF